MTEQARILMSNLENSSNTIGFKKKEFLGSNPRIYCSTVVMDDEPGLAFMLGRQLTELWGYSRSTGFEVSKGINSICLRELINQVNLSQPDITIIDRGLIDVHYKNLIEELNTCIVVLSGASSGGFLKYSYGEAGNIHVPVVGKTDSGYLQKVLGETYEKYIK
jgi:hypothetical protein